MACQPDEIANPFTGACEKNPFSLPSSGCPFGSPPFGGICAALPSTPSFPALPPGFPAGSFPQVASMCLPGTTSIAGYCVPGMLPTTGPLPGPFGGMQNIPAGFPAMPPGVLIPGLGSLCGAGYVSAYGYCVPDMAGLGSQLPAGVPVTVPPGFPVGTQLPLPQGGCPTGQIGLAGYCVPASSGLPQVGPLPGPFGGMSPVPGIPPAIVPPGFPLGTLSPNVSGQCAPGYMSIGGYCVPDPRNVPSSLQPSCDPGQTLWTDPADGAQYCVACGANEVLNPANGSCYCVPGWQRPAGNPSGDCVPTAAAAAGDCSAYPGTSLWKNPATGSFECVACGPGEVFDAASGQCFCSPGWERPAGSPNADCVRVKTDGPSNIQTGDAAAAAPADNTTTYLLVAGGLALAGGLLYWSSKKA